VARQSVPPPLPPIKYAAAAAAAVAQSQTTGVSAGPPVGSLAVGGSSSFSETLSLATSPLSTEAEGISETHTNVTPAGLNSDSALADGLQYTASSMMTSPKVSHFPRRVNLGNHTHSIT